MMLKRVREKKCKINSFFAIFVAFGGVQIDVLMDNEQTA